MKKEYSFVLIIGLFLLAYVLEAVVNPLKVSLTTPYDFLKPDLITHYPFTSAIIAIRALAIFATPVWLFSFLSGNHTAKGVTLLVIAGLAQLYAIQEVATGAQVIPLEWSLSLSLAGVALLLPTVGHLLLGLFHATKKKLTRKQANPPSEPPTN